MEIGICVASQISDVDYIVEAENLGFSDAWFGDSQMLWSDCYATLALAGERTSKINIGTGVAISGTRLPAVHAAGIASINQIAPGRTFFGVGSGNTAMRVMGLAPQKIKAFEEFLIEVKPLLSGQESTIKREGRRIPILHIMQNEGFVNFKEKIPMYVSGFGPKSLGLAGKYGDGAVLAMPANTNIMEAYWKMIEKGASELNRVIRRDSYPTTALTAISILDKGENVDSERIKRECGPMTMASIHYFYDQWRNFGYQPPNAVASVWEEYTSLLSEFPEERRHQRIHLGHNCWVIPEEQQFLTKELLQATCLIGTQEELIDKLRSLNEAGLNQVMNLPSFDPRFEVLETIAEKIIPFV